MKHSTPIIDTVRRQHQEDDAKGRDPYNSLARRAADLAAFAADQKREAEQTLACYETELTLAGPSASKSAFGAIKE